MELFNELSSELFEIVGGLSLTVKVGWPLLMLWLGLQIVWFRVARVVPKVTPRHMPAPAPAPVRRNKPASGVSAAFAGRGAGSPDFIAALARENDERAAALRTSEATTIVADAATVRSVYR
jgi:hypothetical protein